MPEPICAIVGAGDFYCSREQLQKVDYIIAADGGYDHLAKIQVVPDLVIGDFDSSESVILDAIEKVTLPVMKDETDMLSALQIGIQKGYQKFYLYGGTGGARISHTIANLQVLLYDRNVECYLFDREEVLFCISDTGVTFGEQCEGYISVFSLREESSGVTEQNLLYEISDTVLQDCFPVGVSNEFVGKQSRIEVRKGTLLIVVHQDCLPYIKMD